LSSSTPRGIHTRPMWPLRVLLAQDKVKESAAIRQALVKRHPHCEIIICTTPDTVFEWLKQSENLFDVIVVDQQLSNVSGLELCHNLLARKTSVPLILLTPVKNQYVAVEALEAGVYDYIVKDDGGGFLQLLPIVISQVVERNRDNVVRETMETIVKEAFNRVERAKQEWEATIDSLPQAVCLLDKQGRIMRANRTVETWELSPVQGVKGKTIHELLHPDCHKPECSFLQLWMKAWQATEQERMAEFETEAGPGDRYLFWQVRPVVAPTVQREKRDDSFATVVIHDITERKRVEMALQEMLEEKDAAYQQVQIYARDLKNEVTERERAEEVLRQYADELQARNEELDAFAHTVAHDLKNPLGPIIGYAKIAVEGDIPLNQEEIDLILRSVLRNSLKMNSIIEALLLLAGVRNMDIAPVPVDMGKIMDETLAHLDTIINEYNPEIILPDRWPAALGIDPWVEEVWSNYLSNSLKYGGRPPRIELGAREDDKEGMVRFWIRDNGAGLTAEQQHELFTPFTRLSQVRLEGHGLGLSIVQRIVERLGGQVGVESDGVPGNGSTFFFTLPVV